MKLSSRLPPIAAVVAFLLAAIGLLAGLRQIALAVFALIPLFAGIGILRKRVWSAYGFALLLTAQLAVTPLLFSRMGNADRLQLIFSVGLNAALAFLFFLAGRELARSGAVKGWRAPWLAVACLVSVPFLFFQAFVIPTGSMEDTLLIGDRIVARTFPTVKPIRGDVIVYRYPVDRHQTSVKRVIGVPGDRIRITGQVVYRNGSALIEPYAVHKFRSTNDYRDNFPSKPSVTFFPANSGDLARIQEMLQKDVVDGQVLIPPDQYFILGDNRDSSLDSRYWGLLPAKDIIGKAILLYDSQEPPSGGRRTSALGGRIRWNRIFKRL